MKLPVQESKESFKMPGVTLKETSIYFCFFIIETFLNVTSSLKMYGYCKKKHVFDT